jgi:replicative DNA helicase
MSNDESYDRRTEDAVLSILIQDPTRVYDIIDVMNSEMFSSKINETIYKNLIDMVTEDVALSPEALLRYIDGNNQLVEAGGESHILALARAEYRPDELPIFVKSLTNMWRKRKLMEISMKIPIGVHNETDMASYIARIKATLSDLETSGVGKDVVRVSEILGGVYDNIYKRAENPGLAGISTGLSSIDELTGGFIPGSLWIIGARPSMGKTTFLIRTLVDLSKRRVPSLMVSREMGTTILLERILSSETGVHFQNIRFGRISSTDRQRLQNKFENIKKLPLFFDANLYGDVNYISGIVRKHVKMHGVKIVGIDYIQLLASRDFDQTAELGRISRALKLLAEDLGITILVASQLNRELERRDSKKPILSDLRQSGNLEEDADLVFGLYRDYKYVTNPLTKDDIDFLCLKQRNGPIGEKKLKFNENTVTIEDPKNVSKYLGGEIDDEQTEEEGEGLGSLGERITESSLRG